MNDIDYEDEEIQLRLKSCLAILRRRRLDLTAGDTIKVEDTDDATIHIPHWQQAKAS